MPADPTLARLSDQLFWIALALYGVSLVLFVWAFSDRAGRAGMLATIVAALGAAGHATSIATRGLAAGRVPWGNMYEYSSLVALLVVAGYLIVVDGRFRLRQVGAFAMAGALLLMGTARSLYAPAGPLVPALNTYWIKIHVIAAIAASSVFSLSFIFTLLYLLKDRAERRSLASAFGGSTVGAAYAGPGTVVSDEEGFPADHIAAEAPETAPRVGGFLGKLPSAATFDRLALWGVSIAFPIWTFAVIAGALWANKAWGRYWGWDPKETWAFITWVVYAGYLHARATAGWRGRKAAVVNVVGFASLMVTYYVVNLWIVGLHSYAK
jgi:cytochrome c-type biogenesis protein CcsB